MQDEILTSETLDMRFEQLFTEIDRQIHEKEFVIASIDGGSCAGKSTLAKVLSERFDGAVISMDSFFLQQEQRTKERLSEPGGNIDYERFGDQVLNRLKLHAPREPFSYSHFDCKTMSFSETIEVVPKPLIVVEGVYSMHPKFARLYDITAFLKVDRDEQIKRLKKRNRALLSKYIAEWIPMENKYFEFYDIENQCNFVIQ